MARPKLYANAAERQAAYRARNSLIEFRTDLRTANTLDSIASELDASRAELLDSLVKFALCNRNWRTLGLYGKRLDRATPGEGLSLVPARRRQAVQLLLGLEKGSADDSE